MIGSYFSVSLYALLLFVEIYTFEKAASFPSLYGLVFFTEEDLYQSAWLEIVGNLSNLFGGCIFSGLVRIISQLEWFVGFFSLSSESLVLSGLWYCRFSGSSISCRALICSHWPLSAFWVRWYRNQSLGKPPKARTLDVHITLLFCSWRRNCKLGAFPQLLWAVLAWMRV